MSEHNSIYKASLFDARRSGEQNLWYESHQENCRCAKAIEKAISDNYKDNRLNTDAAKDIIKEFGFDRVNYVLANTVQRRSHDGRFSKENKNWANNFYIIKEKTRKYFDINSHPGLTDIFLNRVRKEWQALGLLDKSHCTDDGYYEDKLLVIKPSELKDEYKTPDFQLFYATTGFGCDPQKTGRKVIGYFFKDNERAEFYRTDFIGVAKEECLPDWAKQKLYDMTEGSQSESQEAQAPELKM